MAKKKQGFLKEKWFLVPIVFIILFVVFVYIKGNVKPKQLESTAYRVYQNPEFSFSINYPEAWEIREDTQVFENGDAVAFGIAGPTQKKNTELTDGAQVVISQPFRINTGLTTWVKGYYSKQARFSQMTLAKYPFETVYDCASLGCMTYYFTSINGSVYGVAAFIEGPDKDKMVYENTILYMLESLQFTSASNAEVTEEDVLSAVKSLPEVADYLKRIPNGLVAVNGEEDSAYMVQVYEIKDGHTATFNWYEVDKTTGEVEKQF